MGKQIPEVPTKRRQTFGDRAGGDLYASRLDPESYEEAEGLEHPGQVPNPIPDTEDVERAFGFTAMSGADGKKRTLMSEVRRR